MNFFITQDDFNISEKKLITKKWLTFIFTLHNHAIRMSIAGLGSATPRHPLWPTGWSGVGGVELLRLNPLSTSYSGSKWNLFKIVAHQIGNPFQFYIENPFKSESDKKSSTNKLKSQNQPWKLVSKIRSKTEKWRVKQ